jgi:hypothetical protein
MNIRDTATNKKVLAHVLTDIDKNPEDGLKTKLLEMKKSGYCTNSGPCSIAQSADSSELNTTAGSFTFSKNSQELDIFKSKLRAVGICK